MSDLISRESVIEIIESVCSADDTYWKPGTIEEIRKLPSVQPRIIRCMGCKYYMQTDTLHHRGWCRWWNHFTAIERYCSEGIER